MLEHLFGLTPAEAALADSLADDCSLENAAQQLGRAVGTARVQLQSIFEKTDTKRQASLIRLLMSIPWQLVILVELSMLQGLPGGYKFNGHGHKVACWASDLNTWID